MRIINNSVMPAGQPQLNKMGIYGWWTIPRCSSCHLWSFRYKEKALIQEPTCPDLIRCVAFSYFISFPLIHVYSWDLIMEGLILNFYWFGLRGEKSDL